MSIFKPRVAMLGLLAVMLAGSVMAATASAGPGPFWYHRPIGESLGTGVKITPSAPENFKGEGGKQTLIGTIGSTQFEIASPSVQVKGAIFNTQQRGQIKLEIIYNQPQLIKPVISGCTVKVGSNNVVQVKGHLAWKWDGTQTQLNAQNQRAAGQRVDMIFTQKQPEEEAEEPKGVFTTLTFGSSCGVLAGPTIVSGAEVGLPTKGFEEEEFNKVVSIRTAEGEKFKQHYWNDRTNKFEPLVISLLVANLPGSLIGQTTIEAQQQEVAAKES